MTMHASHRLQFPEQEIDTWNESEAINQAL